MILFFDTETSGLPDMNARASDPKQPHIVQLGVVLTSDLGVTIDSFKLLVKPEGWTIPKEVEEIHGITNEFALANGRPESEVVQTLLEAINDSQLVVAHNITFDKFIARIALRRFGLLTDEQDAWWKALPTFCTMRQMTDVCQLPSKSGRGFKWPSLSEAYLHAFGKHLTGAHDALVDVTACKDLYFWLQNGGAQ